MVFLDHWSNYKSRFTLHKKLRLPDKLITFDKFSFDLAKKTFAASQEGKGTEKPIGGKLYTTGLIERAGGYKDNAYVYGGAIFRKDALKKEQSFAQLNYADTLKFIVSKF